MTNLSDMVWDTDITLVLNTIQPRTCADPDYFYATVDLIEEGFLPTGTGRLTRSELEAWAERVKTGPKTNVKDQTSFDVPPNHDVTHATSRENHNPFRKIHPATP